MSAATRIRFAQQRPLRAADLESALAGELRALALHACAVHGRWGVALGFVLGVPDDGPGRLFVGPGLAYDRLGRPLAASRTHELPSPAGTGRWIVALGPGGCEDRLEAAPRWVRPGCLKDGEVPLAVALTKGSQPYAIGLEERRVAGPAPTLGGGRVEFDIPLTGETTLAVDTSAAGFVRTPHYVASVAAPPSKSGHTFPNVRGPFLEIRDEAPDGFELVVRYAGPYDDVTNYVTEDGVVVDWLGAERPDVAAAPAPSAEVALELAPPPEEP